MSYSVTCFRILVITSRCMISILQNDQNKWRSGLNFYLCRSLFVCLCLFCFPDVELLHPKKTKLKTNSFNFIKLVTFMYQRLRQKHNLEMFSLYLLESKTNELKTQRPLHAPGVLLSGQADHEKMLKYCMSVACHATSPEKSAMKDIILHKLIVTA